MIELSSGIIFIAMVAIYISIATMNSACMQAQIKCNNADMEKGIISPEYGYRCYQFYKTCNVIGWIPFLQLVVVFLYFNWLIQLVWYLIPRTKTKT
jgi:hypothetical protein